MMTQNAGYGRLVRAVRFPEFATSNAPSIRRVRLCLLPFAAMSGRFDAKTA